jgi:hypothetical protein
VARYKFGVLYVDAGQNGASEDVIYANVRTSAAFDAFLNVIGDRVALKGFDGYTGGLNTRGVSCDEHGRALTQERRADGSTGEYSVYAKLAQFEIMFHVAPLLPHQPDDVQQVMCAVSE